jgi:hypothetical protein
MKTLENEDGIALVMVLILSLIALAIISTLIYLVLQGTKLSGAYKRYETSHEASIGGTEIFKAFLSNQGNLVLSGLVNYPKTCNCGDPDVVGDNTFSDGSALTGDYVCLCAKICDPTASWPSSCSTSLDPTSSPDLQFSLSGIGSTTYEVSSKIVDTTIGNSDRSGLNLGGTAVSSSSAGMITAPPLPYLYRVEVNSENTTSPAEKSRLSVLYAY